MPNPKITIGIAAYNVENFVHQAMDCILQQTYTDFEVLCIDDASSDATVAILREYADKDCRVRIYVHDVNCGLSVSRNESVAWAKGEYITFMDADDLVPPDWLETAIKSAEETKADVVMWDYCAFCDKGELPNLSVKPSILQGLTGNDRHILVKRPGFMPTRMFKLSSLRALNTPFPIGCTKQDIPVHWRAMTKLKSIALIPRRMCYYRQHPNATSMRKGKSLFSLYKVMDIVGENLKADGLYEEYRDEFLTQLLQVLHGMRDAIVTELKPQADAIIDEHCADSDVADFLDTKMHLLRMRTQLFYKMRRGDFFAMCQYKLLMIARIIYRTINK